MECDSQVELSAYINRELDLVCHLSLARGTTLGAIKQELADGDPTGNTDPSSIGLKLPPPWHTESLSDGDALPEGVTELDVCSHEEPSEVARDPPVSVATSAGAPEDAAREIRVNIITPAGAYRGLALPAGCDTVSLWKRQLADGTLFRADDAKQLREEKILHADKLRCYEEASGGEAGGEAGEPLAEDAPLPADPAFVVVLGHPAVMGALDTALKRRLKSPDPTRRAHRAEGPPPLPMVEGGGDATLQFHYVALQGKRDHMEDRACARLRLPKCKHAALFGVFDGHGGDKVADLVARFLPEYVDAELSRCDDPETALRRAFARTEGDLRSSAKNGPHFDRVGTTAVVTLILREAGRLRLVCAHCGDSRAVLCRNGQAEDLTTDHKPGDEMEDQRIVAAGGQCVNGRIDGGLNLSRAFGDFDYKKKHSLPPDQQRVSASPDVRVVELCSQDDFVVMGSDGVFEVFESHELVAKLHRELASNVPAEEAVGGAVGEAAAGGDNVTLCLIRFLKHVTPA
mmetsp:Transcript_67920/g.191445  ORF Transcript_67920/g.191445 Transcript_67920/m.191445 type:complete len:516 (+) Transcript_67920:67-1614(+)|eukprot:CAMPEP_0179372524 /NCGR_PEP_ID=MMETSP0797-20121207/86341_1 /TAXON_ID=47934 /ORGANISM="Dinophysis acuminata, Strain DAEP01" /LENGTH=515 /DNA_ID=CAMNT_0021088521 /DNA_START=65 /DNA_END=1612 /DNA_ORIENTATION=+